MQVSINFNTSEERGDFVTTILKALWSYIPENQETDEGETPFAGEQPKQQRKPRREKIEPLADKTPPATPEPGTQEKKVTVDQVRAVVDPLIAAGKQEDLKRILNDFSAPNISGLKPEDYTAFIEQVKAVA